MLKSFLTLSDVFATGHHAAKAAGVNPRTSVTVIGDGAVGLMAVLSAKRLGAERIILMGRKQDRTDLGMKFGTTDVVDECGEEGIAKVRELTGGYGTHTVLEAVGYMDAYTQAAGVVRAVGFGSLFGPNITLIGGPAPCAYIEELLPDVLSGAVNPGLVFDSTIGLDDVAAGYRAMDSRRALKVLVQP